MTNIINYMHNDLPDLPDLVDIELGNTPNCIICFETCNEIENISNMDSYIRENCNCKYDIHEICLDKWLQKQNKCLICHNSIIKINKTCLCINYKYVFMYYKLPNSIYRFLCVLLQCLAIIVFGTLMILLILFMMYG